MGKSGATVQTARAALGFPTCYRGTASSCGAEEKAGESFRSGGAAARDVSMARPQVAERKMTWREREEGRAFEADRLAVPRSACPVALACRARRAHAWTPRWKACEEV